jgi:vancomycin permeability regulator SanA
VVKWFVSQQFTEKADVGVILGTRVHPNGELSVGLSARVAAGAALYRNSQVARLLVSGGVGREGVDEAVAMKHALVCFGVPASDILVDSKGFDTEASAANTAAMVPDATVVVVSQWFHLVRARALFRRAGVRVVGSHAADYRCKRDFYSVPREVVAYIVEVMWGSSRPRR